MLPFFFYLFRRNAIDTVPKSTVYYRNNKEKIHAQQNAVKRTLSGKLTNLITTSRYRAKLQNREHNIDTKYLRAIYEQQKGLCAISGIQMEVRGKGCASEAPYSISLDRIDSDKGYIEGNVWLVCTSINLMKSRLSMQDFIMLCSKVAERFL